MDPLVITVICIVFVAAVAAGVYFVMRNRKGNAITEEKGQGTITAKNNAELANLDKAEMTIRFEDLPALTEEEETRLVEVNDNKLLARIDGAPCYNLGQKGKEIPDRKLLAYRIDREPLPPCVVSVRGSPFGEG